jgi:hypothetical protein
VLREAPIVNDWIYLRHPDAGETRVPNQPGVLESYQSRGWAEMPDPETENQVFVPPKVVEQNEEDGWVTLYHPKTQAVHRFPSHPDAVQGAYEAGWQATPPKTPDPDPAPAGDESAKATKKAPAKSAEPASDEKDVTRG